MLVANRRKEANEQKPQTTSATLSNKKRAIYIVLHVSTIQIGELIGKASAPVKVKHLMQFLFNYGSWLWYFLGKVNWKTYRLYNFVGQNEIQVKMKSLCLLILIIHGSWIIRARRQMKLRIKLKRQKEFYFYLWILFWLSF